MSSQAEKSVDTAVEPAKDETETPESSTPADTSAKQSVVPAADEASGEKKLSKKQMKKLKRLQEKKEKKEQYKKEAVKQRGSEEDDQKLKEKEMMEYELKEDKSLSHVLVELKNISAVDEGVRVKVFGWVQFIRKQSTSLTFIILRDGTGYLQLVLAGEVSYPVHKLSKESSMFACGTLRKDERARGGYEMDVDYWELVGTSDPDFDSTLTSDTRVDIKLDNRHIVIRGEKTSALLKIRSFVTFCLHQVYYESGYAQVTPPSFVQTQVEGGATLFEVKYFGEKAYLTQSSQLYLETCLPSLGKCYCFAPSFRAEHSKTARHLSEYSHVEGEIPFIDFDGLLLALEDLIVKVCEKVMANPEIANFVKEMNPKFKVPDRPFMRMDYVDAIAWLNEKGIKKEDGSAFVFGDSIPDNPERQLVNSFDQPIMLLRFPLDDSPFYMPEDRTISIEQGKVSESVDILLPGVGEVVGGSMRCWLPGDLEEGFKRSKLDPKPYYWYTDQRKYGSVPHGGYGIGFERLICWMTATKHIRDVCLYPRYTGRCQP